MKRRRQRAPSSLRQRLRLLCLIVSLAGLETQAQASVISRFGSLYFYDPLSFDAGVIQRGGVFRGGWDASGGWIDTGLDFPYFKDFSLKVGYVQRIRLGAPDGHILTWRLRMPVLEVARFGGLSSSQLVYTGGHPLARPPALTPIHELLAAQSMSRTLDHWAITVHAVGGVCFRAQTAEDLLLSRLGLTARAAAVVQLYRPPRGLGGKWSVTLSPLELQWVHYGWGRTRWGDESLRLTLGAPAVHFTHRSATYSLGLMPQWHREMTSAGVQEGWGAAASLSIAYRTYLE